MRRYFFDTEFIENGLTIDLISIGIYCEDGREYYAVSNEFDGTKASDWVKERVFPHIPFPRTNENPWRNRKQIAQEIIEFVGSEKPCFWAYYGAYDWVALCQLYGKMIQLPQTWPHYTRDIKQYSDMLGNPRLPNKPEKEHHALDDAKWTFKCWKFLRDAEGIHLFNA
jgi:3' exoribonuclease, RNase T-like